MPIILALDLGTTGNRTLAFDEHGAVIAQAYLPFTQHTPQPGWLEHDAEEIWSTCYATIQDVLNQISIDDVVGLGITNQRETVVMWDTQTDTPLHRAIVWQCRRTHDICQHLQSESSSIKSSTGLPIDPYFSATKIKWLLDHLSPSIPSTKVGTIDSWILWKLTGGHVHATDTTNASRTMLVQLQTGQYDPDLCALFDIPMSILPTIQPSQSHFGQARIGEVRIPILGMIGDQQAAFFAQCGSKPGTLKNTYGTGCFLMAGLGDQPMIQDALITTIARTTSTTIEYACEGSIFMAGATIQWLRDNLHIIQSSSQTNDIDTRCPDTEGVYFVPALSGLGTPQWDAEAKGVITGLTRKTTHDHIVRAGLEAMAYQTQDVMDCFSSTLPLSDTLWVDGGATANPFLMQFQADILQKTILKPQLSEMTALGAAGIAGIQAGIWDLDAFLSIKKIDRIFSPQMNLEKRNGLLRGWHQALRQCVLKP